MKQTIFLFLLAFVLQEGTAQKFDNTWLVGYCTTAPVLGDFDGISILNFDETGVHVRESGDAYLQFWHTNASFSDSIGQLVAYCNGIKIENQHFLTMENGDSLDKIIIENSTELQYYSTDNSPQGCLFLPWPNHPDSLLMIYAGDAFIPIPGISTINRNLSYAVIKRSANNGLGKVVAREQPIIEDTISYGHITAVKHANGRDWWVLMQERHSNRFYRILIDPAGIHTLAQQTVDSLILTGSGQNRFSPDGNTFAMYNGIRATVGAWLDVFDFDRCAGRLSRQRRIFYPPDGVTSYFGGISISPNSRFLYQNFYDTIFQYDLYATNLLASRKVVAARQEHPTMVAFRFYQSQLAPDGKIYACATNGCPWLHIIHNPDEEGVACNVEQLGLQLKTANSVSVPNHPNYRLGPLDGSPCDTLGLNNLPIAWWRYQQDTLDPLSVAFHDLSYYEPTSWSWDFGDGSAGSPARHPQHLYTAIGAYQVCLTVSNTNASNTHCQTLYLGVSATENPVLQAQIQVGPNPFGSHLDVALSTLLHEGKFRLFDGTGRVLREQPISLGINEVDTQDVQSGMYFWEVVSGQERVKAGKVVKF